MIGYLRGKIISKKPTQVLVDVNGVGYLVHISISTFEHLADDKQEVQLFTYLAVRDDALDLFGFITLAEKEMFELLISVNGIGPKLAQSILSGIQIGDLQQAIIDGNLSRITAVPGIGNKTGQRVLIELKDKIKNVVADSKVKPTSQSIVNSDAVAALISLGYNQKTAEKAVSQIVNSYPNATIEIVIKSALAMLNK